MDNIKDRIEKLRLLKRHYDLQYWRNSETTQSDEVYDQINDEFQLLLSQNPQYEIESDKQLESVYMNTFSEVHHKYRMLSLGKCLSIPKFIEWYSKLKSEIEGSKNKELIFEFKIDGFAICLEYVNGILVRGSTRGDGEVGDDITQTINLINDIPKKLNTNFTGEISGEIYMKKSSLIKLNKKLQQENKKELKNVRNAAAGIARQKDTSSRMASYLNFLCYKVNSGDNFETYLEEIKLAKNFGFNVVMDLEGAPVNSTKLNEETINNLLGLFLKERDDFDLDVDGVVIKVNDKELQRKLGEKERTPNWAIAYKFPAIEKITKLLDVEWDYGVKDGRLTPMAIIEPIDIGGTTVKRPTLHNWDQVKRLGVNIGDTIKVSRRGDVIPYVEEVLIELRPNDSIEIDIPNCPMCGCKAKVNGAFVKCNNKDCIGRISGRIKVFVNSMEIDSLGGNTIDKLINSGNLSSIADLFKLNANLISTLDKMGDKSSNKILDNINQSKNNPIWKVLAGLSIPLVGGTTAKLLEDNIETLEDFKNLKIEDLLKINGLGNVASENIVSWLSNTNNIETLEELISLNVGVKTEKVEILDGKLSGLKIAFTGKLVNFTREKCKNLIVLNGGTPWDIKKEINILLIGDGAKQNKIDKANKLGAKVITESEFLQLIK